MAAQDLWDDENVIAPMALNVKKGSDAVRGSAMRVCAPPHGGQGRRPRPTLAARPRLEGALALGLAESTRSSARTRDSMQRAHR